MKANPTPREDASSFTPLVVVISSFVLLLGVAVFATHPNPGQQSKPQVAAAAPRFAFEQYNLGTAYSSGHGVPQSYAEAAKWYRAAAEQGFAGAQYNLGAAYTIGRGVSQDYAEAAKWYRKAAEQGHAEAQYNLGVLYRDGQGVPQDYVAAYTWLTLAMATTWEPRWIKTRDALQHRMTPLQIAEGMQRTAEFVAKKTPATSQ
ncbi:MAG: tetratricopeptide repeat protein [Kiritimatiellaeota bacterium]|nr:tetratricopeptide repeat protein [Kiritimatiellota bacterium]